MLRIDSSKESKFACKRLILIEISVLISLVKISIHELIPILESVLIPLPEPIAMPRSNSDSDCGIDSSIGIGSGIYSKNRVGPIPSSHH